MAYDIRMAKLINGDMVIGKWDAEEKKIKDPAMIQALPTQQGGVQMLLLPFGYPFDQDMGGHVSMEHVLYEYRKCPDELKTKYLEATSNLTLSTPGDLKNLQRMAGDAGRAGKLTDLGGLFKK